MKEVIITKYGPPEVLQVRELETPIPKGNQILVRNQFAGINDVVDFRGGDFSR